MRPRRLTPHSFIIRAHVKNRALRVCDFLPQIETATVQRPIFAAADLENHLRANQASGLRFGWSRALSGCAAFSSRRALRDGFTRAGFMTDPSMSPEMNNIADTTRFLRRFADLMS